MLGTDAMAEALWVSSQLARRQCLKHCVAASTRGHLIAFRATAHPQLSFPSHVPEPPAYERFPSLRRRFALSHPLNFILTNLSHLLKLCRMEESSDYRKAYETAKQELIDLLSQKDRIEKRLVIVRQSLSTLATLCDEEDVKIEPSKEAEELLEHSTLTEEIRSVLQAHYPGWLRPAMVKRQLEHLGHDLAQYTNPQATIHMVLKRLAESEDVEEDIDPEDGKKTYRKRPAAWMRRIQLQKPLDQGNQPIRPRRRG